MSGLKYFLNKRTKSKKREREEKKGTKEKKGERRKGLSRETFAFNTACWLNKADSLKEKEKRKKELLLKSLNYLFGRRLLMLCYILNAPLCWNLLVVLFIYRVAFFCTYLYRFHLFSLNILFALKTLQNNFGNLTTVKYNLF